MPQEKHYDTGISWRERQQQFQQTQEEQADTTQADYYTVLRVAGQRSETLNLALKNGCQHAFPLLQVEEYFYDPAQGILIFLRVGVIAIQGRSLDALYQALLRQRVTEIRDYCETGLQMVEQGVLVVEKITYDSPYVREWRG